MSEYVFNAASNEPDATDRAQADALAVTLLETIAELDARLGGPRRPLKLPQHPWEMAVAKAEGGEAISLGQIINEFYESRDTRELATFFDALQTYAPAVEQLDDNSVEAILRLTPTAPADGYHSIYAAVVDAGFDAMQCVVTGGTLISLDRPKWDFDHAVFACGGDLADLDHASKIEHVEPIVCRQHQVARKAVNRQNFGAFKEEAFPSLSWGQDVARQLTVFPSEYLGLAFSRLANLDDIVRRWRATGAAEPELGNLVFRNESELTMDNYGSERRHRSSSGEMRSYETHVWIDRGNRIHFILDPQARSLEIGYIGPHLRTWTN